MSYDHSWRCGSIVEDPDFISSHKQYEIAEPDMSCSKCLSLGGQMRWIEEYIDREIGNKIYRFDVTRAIELAKNRKPEIVPPWLLNVFSGISETDKQHVDHVSVDHPGIVACFHDCVALVDGHHRAARCKKLNIPFKAYVFDYTESQLLVKIIAVDSKGV